VRAAANLELLSAAKVKPANTVKMTIIAVAKSANILNLLNIFYPPIVNIIITEVVFQFKKIIARKRLEG